MRKQTLAASLLAATTILLIAFGNAEARILNVSEEFQFIQEAVDSSNDGDTILVEPGIYRDRIVIADKSIVLASWILITDDPNYTDITIVNCQANYAQHMYLSGENNRSLIRGFTFRTTGRNQLGGGISCTEGSPTFEDIVVTGSRRGFSNNQAGGLTLSEVGQVTIRRTKIIENEAWSGGISLAGGALLVEDCQIVGNRANMNGGGFSAVSAPSSAVFRRVLIADNVSFLTGGAIYNRNCAMTLDQVTIVNNSIESGSGCGGLYCDNRDSIASLTVSNSIVYGNFGATAHLADHHDAVLLRMEYSDFEGGIERIIGNSYEFGEGNINAHPQFIGDYLLMADSPCVDAGDPEAPLDPDGTQADMGALYFHQRDIAVEEREVIFPPTAWGELDSLPITIINDGLTPLEISQISNCLCMSCVWTNEFFSEGGDPLIIPPEENYQFQVYSRPDSAASMERTIFISSNDPDEPEISIEVTGQAMDVGNDKRDGYPTRIEVSAYPNPFNAMTRIRFTGGLETAATRLAVYGVDGRLVADLLGSTGVTAGRGIHPAAEGGATESSVVWDASNQPAGVYFARLEAGKEVRTMKIVLMK